MFAKLAKLVCCRADVTLALVPAAVKGQAARTGTSSAATVVSLSAEVGGSAEVGAPAMSAAFET